MFWGRWGIPLGKDGLPQEKLHPLGENFGNVISLKWPAEDGPQLVGTVIRKVAIDELPKHAFARAIATEADECAFLIAV